MFLAVGREKRDSKVLEPQVPDSLQTKNKRCVLRVDETNENDSLVRIGHTHKEERPEWLSIVVAVAVLVVVGDRDELVR